MKRLVLSTSSSELQTQKQQCDDPKRTKSILDHVVELQQDTNRMRGGHDAGAKT